VAGQTFEMQFHTPASFDAKMQTHVLYEQERLPDTPGDQVDPLRLPAGLVHRIHTDPHPTDQLLHKDFAWHPTDILHRQWLGHNDDDYEEITEAEADELIARWRVERS
jgi:hypothetical protein